MLDLDFAFFNLINDDRMGLVYRKKFLDRLAPIFFAPRVQNLIQLPGLNGQGCNIVLPLGQGNLELLSTKLQQNLMKRSYKLAEGFRLDRMAVDRRLKEKFQEPDRGFTIFFGENFIKALAYVFIRESLSRRDINKLVVVGEIEELSYFLREIAEFDIPVSLQTSHPARYEVLLHRMLYENGNAVSTSRVNPHKWEKGNLVILFDTLPQPIGSGLCDVLYFPLDNTSCGLAPELERGLMKNGISPALHNIAPIMETCLWCQEGFSSSSGEHNMLMENNPRQAFQRLLDIGDAADVWELFLDKG